MEVNLAEGVKLQLCSMLNHLADIEMRHQVESLIAFSEGYVGEAQQVKRVNCSVYRLHLKVT